MKKLDLDALAVTSFETEPYDAPSDGITTDPTSLTLCYVCPPKPPTQGAGCSQEY